MDNLPQAKPKSNNKKIIKASRSWDSICRSKSMKASPNLPIAQNTARILKRNGLQQMAPINFKENCSQAMGIGNSNEK